MNTPQNVVTRFAPSPTGHLHTGSYRTSFFAYLFAKKHGGKFILRIEDTDRERSKKEHTEEILEVFKRIGIKYDELYIQSEHVDRHREILETLIREDKAYVSRELAKDREGNITGEYKDIIRFRNPNKTISFTDLIRGPITIDTTDLEDFVIAKNIEEPIWHLAVVVDDHDEGINYVIRTEEHISNTPRQILIHEALGWHIPFYAHLPLVLAPDKTKMSKRKGAVAVIEYLNQGYLPEALLNTICLCGWNPGTEQELLSRTELESLFDLDKVQKSGAVFGEEKLKWFNREYIKKLSSEEFWDHAAPWIDTTLPSDMLKKIEPIVRDRIEKFSDIRTLFESRELSYFFADPVVDVTILVPKELRDDLDKLHKTKEFLTYVKTLLETVSQEQWNYDAIKTAVWDYATEQGRGVVLWPMRVALSGREKSPDPFEIASIIGKEKTLKRLEK